MVPCPQALAAAGVDLARLVIVRQPGQALWAAEQRLKSGWWDGPECRRDYWIARDRQGRRLWIFREYAPRCGWFLHGLFD